VTVPPEATVPGETLTNVEVLLLVLATLSVVVPVEPPKPEPLVGA